MSIELSQIALRELLHEDLRLTSPTGDTFTRDDYVERNAAGPVAWRSQRFDDMDV